MIEREMSLTEEKRYIHTTLLGWPVPPALASAMRLRAIDLSACMLPDVKESVPRALGPPQTYNGRIPAPTKRRACPVDQLSDADNAPLT